MGDEVVICVVLSIPCFYALNCVTRVSRRACWMIISTVGACTGIVLARWIPLLSESPRQVKYVCIFHALLGFDVLTMEYF
jgi:hypothetical protein